MLISGLLQLAQLFFCLSRIIFCIYIAEKKFRRFEHLLDYYYESKQNFDYIKTTYHNLYDHTIDFETIRYANFWLANDLMYSNTEKAIKHYLLAFKNVRSLDSIQVDPEVLIMHPLDMWEDEPENEAPGYYIAYNLACCYSLSQNLELSEKWLRIAVRLNPNLLTTHVPKDNDLSNLRKKKEIYEDILLHEPQQFQIENDDFKKLEQVYKEMLENFETDSIPVEQNKLELKYIPQNSVAYGVIVYYESLEENYIEVRLYQEMMLGAKTLGSGSVKIKKGKGLVLIPVLPTKSFEEYTFYNRPSHSQHDVIQAYFRNYNDGSFVSIEERPYYHP